MATDVQPLFAGFPPPGQSPVSDGRDRHQATQTFGPSHDFESMLGRAEARQAAPRHEASLSAAGLKTGAQSRVQTRPKQESTPEQAERPTDAAPKEPVTPRTSATAERKEQPSQDDTQNDQQSREDRRDERSTAANDAMMVAMNAPVTSAPLPSVQAADSPASGAHTSQEGTTKVAAVGESASAVTTSAPTGMSATLPTAGPATVPATPHTTNGSPQDTPNTASTSETATVPADAQGAKAETDQSVEDASSAMMVETPLTSEKAEPDKVTSALAATTAMKQDRPAPQPVTSDAIDRSAILDALSQRSPVSGAQGTAGAEQHLAQDSGRFLDSSGESKNPPVNGLPSGDGNTHGMFLDRMNGLAQPTSPGNDSAVSSNQTGQSTAALRAADTDRLGEFRGATPFAQTVTLDLDPLDMGPLRVRVMMNDQTVHAHIRTEHGELGQGLLQQGQSLESSLRTTGLEMGMLRVTVDQQQGRGDTAWLFQQQQQQGRPSSPNMSQAPAREDERATRGEQRVGSNDRVSIFA